jgi:carboxyl-terminal processing protease
MNSKQNNLFSEFTRAQSLIFMGLLFMAVGISFVLGYFTRQLVVERFGNFLLLQEAHQILIDNAYKDIPSEIKLEYGMIRGMVQAFDDPYTSFIEPSAAELQTNRLEGKFGGIGVRIEKDQKNNVLLYPLPDSPALKAGIIEADYLLKIDQTTIQADTGMDEIQAAIRGPVGSTVKLLISRAATHEQLTIAIIRSEVVSPSLTSNLAPNFPQVGVIHLSVIANSSPNEILKAVNDLGARGAKYFILDLRDNGGGLVEAGVDIARLFLDKGEPVIEEQFRGKSVETYQVTSQGALDKLPLIILVNHNTASAAEILAGALQHNQRAKIIGAKTYGKDAVQLVFPLKDGSNLNVTAGKWWLPGQQGTIGGKGLTPDIILSEDDANSIAGLDLAIKTLTK